MNIFPLSAELTLGSGILARSEHVVLLFSFKLVQFSSNFFDLDKYSLVLGLFLIFEKGFLICGYFPPENWLFPTFGKKASHFQD
jgi:hypothetical protein